MTGLDNGQKETTKDMVKIRHILVEVKLNLQNNLWEIEIYKFISLFYWNNYSDIHLNLLYLEWKYWFFLVV